MNIQIFGTKKSFDTKKAERYFKERGIKYQFVDMKEKGLSKGEFNSVCQAVGGMEELIDQDCKDKDLLALIKYIADEDKEEALPLIRRFYNMGFNIEATSLTGERLKQYGIRTRILGKPSEGSSEILDAIRAGYVSYVINTRAILSGIHYEDGIAIRNAATQNNITMLTSLDTVKVLLDVLEEVTIGVSTIDAE